MGFEVLFSISLDTSLQGLHQIWGSSICCPRGTINLTKYRLPCALPCLLLLSPLSPSRLPPHPCPYLGTVQPLLPLPGKRVASRGQTFLSSPMGRSSVQQGTRFRPRGGVEKLTAACAWCMRPAFAVAAPVLCANSVNGMAA